MFILPLINHLKQVSDRLRAYTFDSGTEDSDWAKATRALEFIKAIPHVTHHERGGDYILIGTGTVQSGDWLRPRGDTDGWEGGDLVSVDNQPVAIYVASDGSLWVRPTHEFEDGRFIVTESGNEEIIAPYGWLQMKIGTGELELHMSFSTTKTEGYLVRPATSVEASLIRTLNGAQG